MIIYGKNVAKETINSDKIIKKIYLSNNFKDKELLEKIKKYNKEYLSIKEMNNIVNGNHQGIIMEIEDYKYNNFEDVLNDNFIVILDHLEDPHNFGAIIRTCEAAGVNSIIISKNRSVSVNGTVMKVSSGALSNVKIVEVNNIPNAIDKLKKNNFWIYGTDLNNSNNYTNIKYDKKTVLVIGSESSGISRLVKEKCDFIINIPMKGKVNSLNASVAAGIIIYEVIRQRKLEENEK